MLEVLIGMIFVYLLLSMLCSAVSEYAEALLNYRAKDLRKGIELLLNDTGDREEGGAGKSVDLASRLYNHGLIRPLYRDAKKLPSYIPARTFALALWNMAGGEDGDTTDLNKIKEIVRTKVPNKELQEALVTLIDEARGDFEQARKNIEDWYDGAMDRVSGWYKRRVHIILLVTGFLVSAFVNADTIQIARALVQNDTLRAAIADAAEQKVGEGLPAPTPTPATPQERRAAAEAKLQQTRADLNALGLPLGWVENTAENALDPRRVPGDINEWLLKIVGLLLTGLAVSQGAPFWFDLLNKFIVIRSTVKPKEKSQEQPSKDKPAPETEEEKKTGGGKG
jgi:hypothetical protein